MAGHGGLAPAAVVLFGACVSCAVVLTASASLSQDTAIRGRQDGDREARVPLYIRKARLLLERQKAYERTMQARMTSLSQATAAFASQLYKHHVNDSNHGNVLLSPLGAYTSLAMALTASQGRTKQEVQSALAQGRGDGRGIHSSLQRALTSLMNDDTDDVNDDIGNNRKEDLSMPQSDEPQLSDKELEDIVRNDYLVDSSISYNTGQTHISYSTAIRTGSSNRIQRDDTSDSDRPPRDLHVRVATGMFHNEDVALSQHFFNRLVSLYGAPPMAIQPTEPLETSVNVWVEAATRGTVPDMLAAGSVSQDTLLVLVNAVSFWGQWEGNFDEKETIPLEFTTLDGDTVMAPCVYRAANYSVKQMEEVGAKVLELPYANPRYSLFIFLPRGPSSSSGLQDLERRLSDPGSLQQALRDMPDPSMTIVLLPKFHLRARTSLASELQGLGVRRLFLDGKADLRRMTDDEERLLYVNDVFQYAALEVNEGTRSSSQLNSVTFGSGVKEGSSLNSSDDNVANSTDHVHISDVEDDNATAMQDYDYQFGDEAYDDDEYYDEYDYEEYDYSEELDPEESGQYFIADRPFVFVLKDKENDLVVLMGRVTNPLP